MTPYVIDQSKRQEYFLFLVFFVVLSFALGYFFGYQSGKSKTDNSMMPAEKSSQDTIKPSSTTMAPLTKTLVSAKKSEKKTEKKTSKSDVKDKSEAKKKSSNTQKKVKQVKKDKEVKKASSKRPEKKKKEGSLKNKIVSRVESSTKSRPKLDVPKKSSKKIATTHPSTVPVSEASSKVIQSITSKIETKQTAELKKQASYTGLSPNEVKSQSGNNNVLEMVKDSAAPSVEKMTEKSTVLKQKAEKALTPYSVQVGMFASQPNAEKFVNTLKENGFKTYLGNFVSSNGKQKFNVRLGPYKDRQLAREKMSLYKQNYSTPAYIVISK